MTQKQKISNGVNIKNRIQTFLRESDIRDLMAKNGYGLQQIINEMLKIGFKGLQLPERIAEKIGKYYTPEEIYFIKNLSKGGIQISYHHDQHNTNLAQKERRYLTNAKKSIDRAVALGADYIVFHLGFVDFDEKSYNSPEILEEGRKNLVHNLKHLIKYAARREIDLMVENNHKEEYEYVRNTEKVDCEIDDFEYLRSELERNGKRFKINFDTGHAFIQGAWGVKDKRDIKLMVQEAKKFTTSFIKQLGKNIYATHISDNTLTSHDDHMIVGDGIAPIEFTLKKLLESGYQGGFLYELHTEKWQDKYNGKDTLEIYKIAYQKLLKILEKVAK